MSNHSIKLKKAFLGYGNPILGPIDLSFESPGIIGVLGNNGIGKSTLLKGMAGILPLLQGQLFVDDKLVKDQKYLATKVACSFGHFQVNAIMNVYDLLATGRFPYSGFWGVLSRNDRDKIHQQAEQFELLELMNRSIGTLSDGQAQRVLLARACIQETPIILMDEPTRFLDNDHKISLIKMLLKLVHQDGKLIIFSTHERELFDGVCDQYLYIDSHHCCHQGDIKSLQNLLGFPLSLNEMKEKIFSH